MKTRKILPITKQEILELLQLLNWPPEKLALEFMVDPRTVYRWLSGESHPPPQKAARLRQLLDEARKPETARRKGPIRNPLESDTYSHYKDNTESTSRRKLASHREE